MFMFSIVCNSQYLPYIKGFINSIGDTIIFCDETDDIDIIADIEEVSELAGRYLILDISLVDDLEDFLYALEKLRFKKERLQVIIFAPDKFPGDLWISRIVQFGIYDIINPKSSDVNIKEYLLEQLIKVTEQPSTYADVLHWDNNQRSKVQDISVSTHFAESKENNSAFDTPSDFPIPEQKVEVIEKTVTITQNNIMGVVTIAVAGTLHRIGTTHLCIMIAEYLKSVNYNVALAELHESNHFYCISQSYDDVKNEDDKYILDEITFYPYNSKLSISEILLDDYDYVILDMGLYSECDRNEFRRADLKLLVNGAKEWEIQFLRDIMHENSKYLAKYYYLFNFCNHETLSYVQKIWKGYQVNKIPYMPNPFLYQDTEVTEYFDKLLKNIIPEQEKKRNSKIFSHLFSFGKKVKNYGI